MFSRISAFFRYVRANRFDRHLLRYFDWPLFFIVLFISLFGVVTIFSASTSGVTSDPETLSDMLSTQPITYARLQLIWLVAGFVAMFAIMYFQYDIFGRYANFIYTANIVLLLLVLGMKAGRGGMTAFFTWGSSAERTLQPSEFGKVAIIIAFAKAFSVRTKPVMTFKEVIPLVVYLAIPLVLIVAQPDVGTAMVYMAIFCVMVFVSGTNYKLILAVLGFAVLLLIPLWYVMTYSDSENFRLTRVLIWLDPYSYPDEARQVINAQIAVGAGGMTGRGAVATGSFASLGYISDDHTDFIFAVCCEAFGFVGAGILVLAYLLMLIRLLYLAMRVSDPFGSYVIIGVLGMFLFHIVENLCMVIGLLPVTGIPLPFMSYGGSNMLTNMMAIGLVMNVVMRSRQRERRRFNTRELKI